MIRVSLCSHDAEELPSRRQLSVGSRLPKESLSLYFLSRDPPFVMRMAPSPGVYRPDVDSLAVLPPPASTMSDEKKRINEPMPSQDRGGRTLVLCFDGPWNSPSILFFLGNSRQDQPTIGTANQFDETNTNIVHIFSFLQKEDPNQLVYYQTGKSRFLSLLEKLTSLYRSGHLRRAKRDHRKPLHPGLFLAISDAAL